MNFVEVLRRRGSERAREIYKNLRTLWYGRWRDEVVEFVNYNGGGDQCDYEGTRRQRGIMGFNGGRSRGVHKVVSLVFSLDRTVENASFLSTRSNEELYFVTCHFSIWSINPMS